MCKIQMMVTYEMKEITHNKNTTYISLVFSRIFTLCEVDTLSFYTCLVTKIFSMILVKIKY